MYGRNERERKERKLIIMRNHAQAMHRPAWPQTARCTTVAENHMPRLKTRVGFMAGDQIFEQNMNIAL